MSLRTGVNRLCFLLNNLNVNSTCHRNLVVNRITNLGSINNIHTSCRAYDIMEFFDDKENWGQREVPCGRSWKLEELRIKSNSDLHKLWYVLLKEKNMLLTMEHEYNQKYIAFPSPERIDKVEESMENIETVVRERNKAYHELETGENGERPIGENVSFCGLRYKFRMSQHAVPRWMNRKFMEMYKLNNRTDDHHYVRDFLTKLEEKKRRKFESCNRHHYKEVCEYLKRFPNVDVEALKEKYPHVDIEKAMKDKEARCHGENAY